MSPYHPPGVFPLCKACPYFLVGKAHLFTKSSQTPLLQITVTHLSFPPRAPKSKNPGMTSPWLCDPGKVTHLL